MDTTFPDPTSTRLRQAALAAAAEFERPVTAHELEGWIAQHDPPLADDLSHKCYDYVRIILSLTPDTSLVKFTCTNDLLGIDRRSRFYGSAHSQYDPNVWIPVSHRTKKDRPRPQQPSPERSARPISAQPMPTPISILFPIKAIPPFEQNVSQETADRSWFVLTTLYPANSGFWSEFMPALTAIGERVAAGADPAMTLEQLMRQNECLAHPAAAEDVVHILSREATQAAEVSKRRLIAAPTREAQGIMALA
jgi:hypothetical protein